MFGGVFGGSILGFYSEIFRVFVLFVFVGSLQDWGFCGGFLVCVRFGGCVWGESL